ncbi:MAG: hypothetical protein O9301_08470 [Leptospira sp.]|nr:hypothetical protein [Leptospira sp.]
MNPTNGILNLRLIYAALLLGPIVFLGILLTVLQNRTLSPIPNLELIGLGVGFVGASMALFIPKIMASNHKVETGLDSRYFLLKMIQWSVLESNILTNVTFFFLNNSITNVYVSIVLLAILAFLFPSENERKRYFPN